MVNVVLNDILQWAKDYDGEPFHAMLTDPPYHLTTITKRFGKENSAPAKFGTDGAFARASKGFMGQQWDGGDIAFQPETWASLAEHLYPGAFGMAFASSRGWHRLAVAIEDAGLIIHPTIFLWLQGQGFPKATRIDNQIDRDAGVLKERIVGNRSGTGYTKQNVEQGAQQRFTTQFAEYGEPVTNLAKAWEGHRYGLQALKPCTEPIIVFQRPYEGRPLDCITNTGAGALNIDAARIQGEPVPVNVLEQWSGFGQAVRPEYEQEINNKGRLPANFILGDGEAAERLNAQSGVSRSRPSTYNFDKSNQDNPTHIIENIKSGVHFDDRGGASRFFFQVQEQLDEADPVYYCPKASTGERNAGMDEFPEKDVAYSDYR